MLLLPVLMAALFMLGRRLVDAEKKKSILSWLICLAWTITILAWLVNIIGTYVSYPPYRAQPPKGVADLQKFPRSYLLSLPYLAIWEKSGMKWKEHLGWFAPLLCTPAAYVISVYGKALGEMSKLRTLVMTILIIAFITAAVTGFIGILVTKLAPVR